VCVQTQWASEIGVTPAGQAEFSALVKVVNGSRVMVSVCSHTSACVCVFMCAYYICVCACVCVCVCIWLFVSVGVRRVPFAYPCAWCVRGTCSISTTICMYVCTCAIGVIRTDCVPMHLQDQAVQRSGGQIDSGIICQDRVAFGCVLPLHNFHSCVCFKDST